MSKEYNVTYFITFEIFSLFADASNSFFANTRECLFMELLYISSVLEWKLLAKSFRRCFHFVPDKENKLLFSMRMSWTHIYYITLFDFNARTYLNSTEDLRLAKVSAFRIRDLCQCFRYWIKVPFMSNIMHVIVS